MTFNKNPTKSLGFFPASEANGRQEAVGFTGFRGRGRFQPWSQKAPMGVSLNGGTPKIPRVMIIFSRKTHGFVGETHHFRKPPYVVVVKLGNPSAFF